MPRILLVPVVAAMALVACGGGDDTAGDVTTAPTEAPATFNELCEWFTADIAEQVLGGDVTPADNPSADSCAYHIETGANAAMATSDPRGFDVQKETFEGTDVPGLGRAAFNSDTGFFVVVDDDLALQFIVVTPESGLGVDQQAAIELAELVLPNVG